MYNTSKGNYSVKLNKVIEKFNLKNLTPEVDTKKIVIRQTDVNRPALQFAGYFEYFDYSRIQLIGKVEYSYLKMHDDDYIREMTEKIFKAGIPCMIFCRGLEPRPLFMELGNKYGVPVLATDDGTSSFFSELNRFLKIELAPRISIHGVLVDVFGEGVLITGESGTGKEVITNQIYQASKRFGKPFLKVNCAAIPDTLMESELFGYEPGAFTGASKSGKTGIFELANGGTLMLDEIGEMSMPMQTKLLRVLQNHEVTKVGSSKAIPIDVRIIAATNRNLLECIKEKTFREDLYYRLNVVPISLAPLRERKEDIDVLVHHFLDVFNKKYNKQVEIYSDALHLMTAYNWPGNIREMRNFCERLCILCQKDTADTDDIYRALPDIASPTLLQTEKQPEKSPTVSEEFPAYDEKAEILKALALFRNNRSRTAEYLNMHPSTLWRKMKKYGI